MTSAAYAELANPSSNTLYFVNDSGTFGPESMETGGYLYLGDKLICGNGGGTPAPAFDPANPMSNHQGLFLVTAGAQGNTTAAWNATLDGLTGYYNGLKIVLYNNTGAASGTSLTLNINSLGARTVSRDASTAINALRTGSCTLLTYVGTPAEGQWIMDSYYDSNTTYTLINAYYNFGSTLAGTHGIKKYGLCAITDDGKLSTFTTTSGTGAKDAVDSEFKLGQPIFYNAATSDIAENTQLTSENFHVSRLYFDMRYTGTNTVLSSAIGHGHDVYLEVTVNPEAGTYTPTWRLLVTDAQLNPYNFYIHVGRQQSNSSSYWNRCSLLANNPLYYYDGTNLIPYDTWRASALQKQLANVYRFVDCEAWYISQNDPVSEYEYSKALNTANDLAAIVIDFDLFLTLITDKPDAFNVDVWIELRFTDDDGETWGENLTEVLASTSVKLAGKGNESCATANVLLHAYAHNDQIVNTSYPNHVAYLFVCAKGDPTHACFNFIGGDGTPVAHKGKASMLFTRYWLPMTVQ